MEENGFGVSFTLNFSLGEHKQNDAIVHNLSYIDGSSIILIAMHWLTLLEITALVFVAGTWVPPPHRYTTLIDRTTFMPYCSKKLQALMYQ